MNRREGSSREKGRGRTRRRKKKNTLRNDVSIPPCEEMQSNGDTNVPTMPFFKDERPIIPTLIPQSVIKSVPKIIEMNQIEKNESNVAKKENQYDKILYLAEIPAPIHQFYIPREQQPIQYFPRNEQVNFFIPGTSPTQQQQMTKKHTKLYLYQPQDEVVPNNQVMHLIPPQQLHIQQEKKKNNFNFESRVPLKSNTNQDNIVPKKKELPIAEHREEIINLIEDNRIVIVTGYTGCGKSTRKHVFV